MSDTILLYKFKISKKWLGAFCDDSLACVHALESRILYWFRRFLWREVRVKDTDKRSHMSTCRLVCVRPCAEKLGRRSGDGG